MLRPVLLWFSAAILAAGIAPVASAQILPLTVPRGKLRWDFSGRFEEFDWRWRDGGREEAAADWSGRSLDRTFIPGLGDAEDRVRRIAGINASLTLGTSRATTLVNRGALGIGGAVGITDRITLFASVPIVRIEVKPRFSVDTIGANTAIGPDNSAVLAQLTVAVDSLQKLVAGSHYDADPALKALAVATLGRAVDLQQLLSAPATGAFLPRAGTTVGDALLAGILSVQQNLNGPLGLSGFTTLPVLPEPGISAEDFDGYITDPAGPIRARPLGEVPATIAIGDIEVGAALGLFDRFPRSDLGTGARSALAAKFRLRTARLAAPDRFFDVSTGDRQPAVELDWVTDLATGRLGARLSAGYSLEFAALQDRRVADPRQPLAAAASLATVRRDPGDQLRLTVSPFFRLAPYLSLFAGVDYWRRGTDRWTYAPGQDPIPGVDVSVLGLGSKADAVLLSGGISYSHSGLDKYGAIKLPMEAALRYRRIASSTSGIVPDANLVTIDLRFYSRLWGK